MISQNENPWPVACGGILRPEPGRKPIFQGAKIAALILGLLTAGCGSSEQKPLVVLPKYKEPVETPAQPQEIPEKVSANPLAEGKAPPPAKPPQPTFAEDLEWLLAHSKAWPKEVTMKRGVPVHYAAEDGQEAVRKLLAGDRVKVAAVTKEGVQAIVEEKENIIATLPFEYTDLASLIPQLKGGFKEEAEMDDQQDGGPDEKLAVGDKIVLDRVQAEAWWFRDGASPRAVSATAQGGRNGPRVNSQSGFVHPGLMLTDEDFARMRDKVKAEESPWIESWQNLEADRQSQLGWNPRPLETVIRAARGNFAVLFKDIQASYQLALRWKISGDEKYAEKSIQILNAWSSTMKQLTGNSDRFLGAGIYGYQFANVAEIMRTYPGWRRSDFERFQKMMLANFYPMNRDFLLRHNDAAITNYWANWDLCNIASMQAIGVLCDRRDIYNEAMDYFLNTGKGNGSFDKIIYYVHDGNLGQWQESGRDQGHTTLGIALAGPILETAWNQGQDLYSYDNNRFLAAAEYIAKYNLGQDVPYQSYQWGTGQKGDRREQPGVSPAARGIMRPCYELVINHYVSRKGISAPYSALYAARIRPEGGGGNGDQVGWGSLTFMRDLEVSDPAPSGLVARKQDGRAVLSWWGAVGSESYKVKRSVTKGGPYEVIAENIRDPLAYTDEPGSGEFFYVVAGVRDGKETALSNEADFHSGAVLFAQWSFDETGGKEARDSVGTARSGVLEGRASFRPGTLGNALSLSGKEAWLAFPEGLVEGLSDFSISAWVRLDSTAAWSRIFDFGNDRGMSMFLTPNAGDGKPAFGVGTVYHYNLQWVRSSEELPPRRWVHVAFTLSGHHGKLFLNGISVGESFSIDFPPFRLGRTPGNYIGRSQNSADPYLDGEVDDFRIYDGALGDSEIAALAAEKK